MKYFIAFFVLLFVVSCTNTGQKNNNENTSTWDNVEISEENNVESEENMEDVTFSEIENGYSFDIRDENMDIFPLGHASMIMQWQNEVFYVDPVDSVENYSEFPAPTTILVTHEHGDHFNLEVLEELVTAWVRLIVNPGVYSELSQELKDRAINLSNDELTDLEWFMVEAVPAYNVREEAQNYHPRWRDNWYIIENNWARIYVSWDTEDTPELRELQNIDIAFLSMNLPYTMPIDSAVDWTVAFAPKVVFPYHYRWEEEMADVESYKNDVETQNQNIRVVLHDWYQGE